MIAEVHEEQQAARPVVHVQVYDVARTAHFERILRAGSGTTVLYSERRYDFDQDLAAKVGARKAGALGAFRYTLSHDIDVLEVAEPLLVRAAPRSFAAIVGARVRASIRRRNVTVVTYAIENKDPREGVTSLPWRARLKLGAQRLYVAWVWRALDRVAYGTSQSQELYRRVLGGTRATHRLIPALPAADERLGSVNDPRPPVVTFLGEFSQRKGFPLLLRAWPLVHAVCTDARLLLIGKGAGIAEAQKLAERDPAVRVEVDPSRERIFELLASSKVCALPSQPRPRWREQVGLPIVEALERGCLIVTTTETGLAGWLREHRHEVVADAGDVDALARALVSSLQSERTPTDVLADLPAIDGRAEAERWIITGAVTA